MNSTPEENSSPNDIKAPPDRDTEALLATTGLLPPEPRALPQLSENSLGQKAPGGVGKDEPEPGGGASDAPVGAAKSSEPDVEPDAELPAGPRDDGAEDGPPAGEIDTAAADDPDPPDGDDLKGLPEGEIEEYDPAGPSFVEQVRAFLVLLAITAFVAGLASRWTSTGMDGWYAGLRKPDWTPPGWVFRSIWAAVYLKVTVAAWLVWRRAGFNDSAEALSLWVLQLCLNAAWPGLFFGMRSPALAAVEIPLLWLAVAATAREMRRIHPGAALLMAPYLIWVAFLGLLNYLIWWMNSPM